MPAIKTGIFAQDLKRVFIDQFSEYDSLEDLAQTYAAEYAGLFNGERAHAEDEDQIHDLDSQCHDHARQMTTDDLTDLHIEFLIITNDELLTRKPCDHLGSETPRQLVFCNIEEMIRDRANELIEEMRTNGECEKC